MTDDELAEAMRLAGLADPACTRCKGTGLVSVMEPTDADMRSWAANPAACPCTTPPAEPS